MDTLRQLAQLPSDKFAQDISHDRRLQCFSARTYNHATRNRSWNVQEEAASNALQNLIALENEPDVSAALSLVKIPRDDNEVIGISEASFRDIFNACRLDPRFLHLVRNNRYGLHYESWQRRHCYYIGTVLYSLMWAYNPITRTTRAILLLRDSGSARSFPDFQRILELESSRLHNPFLLAWVSLVQLSNWVDLVTYTQLTSVRKLENVTGHGPYGGNPATINLREQQENMEELTKASRKVGSVLVDLANQSRHVAMGLSIVSHLMSAIKLDRLETYTDDHFRDMFLEQLEAFTSGVPSIKRSLLDSKEYIVYIQERAKNQATVIASLLTHEDARISIKLAQASKDLAEAAEKDSSAMKTIAIMTMLFLPGTFFAALWAVPSLQWGKEEVVQDNFWVYWAFTVPSTVVVFTIWFGLHRWRYSSIRSASRLYLAPLSLLSAIWPSRKNPSQNSKLNGVWPSGSQYLPLAIGGQQNNMSSAPPMNDHHYTLSSVPYMTPSYQASPYESAGIQLTEAERVSPQPYQSWQGPYVPEEYSQEVPVAPVETYGNHVVPAYPYSQTANLAVPTSTPAGVQSQDWAHPSPLSPVGAAVNNQAYTNLSPYPYTPQTEVSKRSSSSG